MKRLLNANPPKLLIAVTVLVVLPGIGFRVWWVRSGADGRELAEGRHLFHQQQMAFKSRCEQGVIGRRIEEVLPVFGGLQSRDFGGTTYSWKLWPCDLVVRDGLVEGVFYHDFPYKMQPLPPEYRYTHVAPYFERHPEYLGDEYAGRWDRKGGYVFEKTR